LGYDERDPKPLARGTTLRTEVAIALTLVSMLGCSGHADVRGPVTPESGTGMNPGDAVVVTLNSLRECGTKPANDCVASAWSSSDESEVERCVGAGLKQRIKNIETIRASRVRDALVAPPRSRASLRSVESILEALDSPSNSGELHRLQLKYVVVIDIETSDSPTQSKFDMSKFDMSKSGGGLPAMGVVRTQWHMATYTATILDAREARKAGVITVDASGRAEHVMGVGFLYIIPVPIVLPTSFSTSKSEACAKLSGAVAQFLKGSAPVAEYP
jgi:hypothetical protein